MSHHMDFGGLPFLADPKRPKPPPTVLGVAGFVALETKSGLEEMREKASKEAFFNALSEHPPFQMFIGEGRHQWKGPQIQWKHEFLQWATANDADAESLFNEYCQWHVAKGYWPNETPLGRLIDGN